MSGRKTLSEKQLRSIAVQNAIGSSLLEGAIPSPFALANLDLYIEGKMTLEALIAEAKHRHSQPK